MANKSSCLRQNFWLAFWENRLPIYTFSGTGFQILRAVTASFCENFSPALPGPSSPTSRCPHTLWLSAITFFRAYRKHSYLRKLEASSFFSQQPDSLRNRRCKFYQIPQNHSESGIWKSRPVGIVPANHISFVMHYFYGDSLLPALLSVQDDHGLIHK